MTNDLRWGIMGTGWIAGDMARTLETRGSPVVAVGSSRIDAAAGFAERFRIPVAVEGHRAVADRDDVDIVYVATTNDLHHRNVLDCIERGKAVLCEKPVALNHRQAWEMLAAAKDAGVFVMEALWMRFLPFFSMMDDLIAGDIIGAVRHVDASLSFPAPTETDRRWLNPELGGGALLDLGVYPLSLVHHLLGPPLRFATSVELGPTGVDLATGVLSEHDDLTSASVYSSFTAQTADEAVIAGTEGRIRMHAPMHHSPRLTVERNHEVVESFETGFEGHGFEFEVAEVERCVGDGMVESRLRPHAATLEVMEWMDGIRAQGGVRFPAEGS